RLPAFVFGKASPVTRRVQSSSLARQARHLREVISFILQRTAVRRGRSRLAPWLPVTRGWLPRVTGRSSWLLLSTSTSRLLTIAASPGRTRRGPARRRGGGSPVI